MQVSLVSSNGLERRLEVTVPGELVSTRVDERLKDLARTARLKGFRPGKVPFSVVRKQYGGQVHSEAVTDLMQKSFVEAVTQERLRPAGDPRIEPLQVAPGRNSDTPPSSRCSRRWPSSRSMRSPSIGPPRR